MPIISKWNHHMWMNCICSICYNMSVKGKVFIWHLNVTSKCRISEYSCIMYWASMSCIAMSKNRFYITNSLQMNRIKLFPAHIWSSIFLWSSNFDIRAIKSPITLGKPLAIENFSMVRFSTSPFGHWINLGARQCKAYVIRLTALNAVAFSTPNWTCIDLSKQMFFYTIL